MINRINGSHLISPNITGAVINIAGPRQAGKSSLLKEISGKCLWLDASDPSDREFLQNANPATFASRIGDHTCVIIDKAQRVENIRDILNTLIKNHPEIRFYIISNSTLVQEEKEKKRQNIVLLPLSFEEMCNHHGLQKEFQLLEYRMTYGYYPEVVMNPGKETELLKQLSNNFLYTDILMWERIQKPERFEQLVKILALEIGKTVSFHDLGKKTGLTNETIEKYIQFLEREYVVFTLSSFSRDVKSELTKSKKIYFYDTGLRNALLNQFGALRLRSDVSALWENFILVERKKFLNSYNRKPDCYFWRTKDQAEIKYLEIENEVTTAYDFQFITGSRSRFPKSFTDAYSPSELRTIYPENIHEWITRPDSLKMSELHNSSPDPTKRNLDYSMELD